jgi:hypothetical protein
VLVEFCVNTRVLDADDRAEAERLIDAETPPLEAPPEPEFFAAAEAVRA